MENPAVNQHSQSAVAAALDLDLDRELQAAERAGLRRRLRRTSGAPGPRMRVDGREVLMLAGANYLDLSGDPRVLEAGARALASRGSAAGGARLISGNLDLHEDLERALARFLGMDATLLFSTGYMANLGLVTALAGPGDTIVSDRLNHASIIDACKQSGAAVRLFEHDSPEDLERVAKTLPASGRRILILDGVYSMDGDVAALAGLVPVARAHDLLVVLDDTHGFGLLGASGRGSAEEAGVPVDVVVGNLGKALGSFGAFVAGSHTLREWLVNRARSFIFTCALPPVAVACAHRALELQEAEPWRRRRLAANAETLRTGLGAAGFDTGASRSHIVPIVLGSNARTMDLCERALVRGIYAQGIRYPSVPQGTARLRLTPTAGHTEEDMRGVVDTFAELGA